LIGFRLAEKVRALQLELLAHSVFDRRIADDGLLEAQMVPLSKHLPVKISCTAFGTLADRSMNTGTLPGPTPNAGLP
jgi:hypothetical protein